MHIGTGLMLGKFAGRPAISAFLAAHATGLLENRVGCRKKLDKVRR